jgi:hypothetical protein
MFSGGRPNETRPDLLQRPPSLTCQSLHCAARYRAALSADEPSGGLSSASAKTPFMVIAAPNAAATPRANRRFMTHLSPKEVPVRHQTMQF